MDYFHVITNAVTGEVTQVPFTDEEIAQYQEESKICDNESAIQQRLIAYRNESDPLFFKWQRGEVLEQEWLDKVAEIKARYPKV